MTGSQVQEPKMSSREAFWSLASGDTCRPRIWSTAV